MLNRSFVTAFSALALAVASLAAHADVVFTPLGTNAPPTMLGSYSLTAFNTTPQTAIADYTAGIITIPGSPIPGDLQISAPGVSKYTALDTWGPVWAHGYAGPVFFTEGKTLTLTLPANTHAFYFYVQGDIEGINTFVATTDGGTSSGPTQSVTDWENDGASGIAFHATAGETIRSVTVQLTDPHRSGFTVAEFGVDVPPLVIPPSITCANAGYTGTQLQWCRKICESELSGKALDTWLQRWTRQYRELPYCARPTNTPV